MIGRGELTAPMQRLLSALFRGNGERHGGCWIVADAQRSKFQPQTVEAAYDRCLVKITVESRHRKRLTLELTEIGEAVARDIERKAGRHISEKSARLIQEIVDNAA